MQFFALCQPVGTQLRKQTKHCYSLITVFSCSTHHRLLFTKQYGFLKNEEKLPRAKFLF